VTLRYWTGSLLTGSVLAVGACMWTAASAEAAPSGGGAGGHAASSPAAKSSADKQPTTVRSFAAVSTGSVTPNSAVSVAKSAHSAHLRSSVTGSAATAATAALRTSSPQPAAAVPTVSTVSTASAASAASAVSSAPGSSVQTALQEIASAQSALTQQTWGKLNVVAGAAALAPQVLLAVAQASLTGWEVFNPAALTFAANTANNPITHFVADAALLETEMLPALAWASMRGASLLIPVVGFLGASAAATQASELVSAATQNGRVYALVPVTMKSTTEPVVYISVNGGPMVAVLVDSGSSGLVIDPQYVGAGLGSATGSGASGYSGGLSYSYDTYTTTVNFGNGIVSSPTNVDIVSEDSASDFANYFAPAGVVGVLGIGPNAGGPDTTVPLTALPGELGDGALLDESLGFLVLGPNPLPARVTVAGAPYTNVEVQVGSGSKTSTQAVIDSGGVTGTMPAWLLTNGQAIGEDVPAGTKISVYTSDGSILLYSYTTTAFNTPTVVTSDDALNTGYTPFQQGPVYIGLTDPNGTTSFDYL
jgi:hypothetical protein